MSHPSNISAVQYNSAINDKFKDLCMPLFSNFLVTRFFYIRIFEDNSIIYLCNDKKWVECYVGHDFQNDSLHVKTYLPDNRAYSLWSGFTKDQVYAAIYDRGIWNGFNLYEKQEDGSIVTYAFASERSNESIINFYINNVDILKNFVAYFKNSTTELIKEAHKHKLIATGSHVSLLLGDRNREEENIKKFYQGLKVYKPPFKRKEELCLTKRESTCLYQLAAGKTAKEAGRELGLSSRTVEFYLTNIKKKMGLRTKAELIRTFLENANSKNIFNTV